MTRSSVSSSLVCRLTSPKGLSRCAAIAVLAIVGTNAALAQAPSFPQNRDDWRVRQSGDRGNRSAQGRSGTPRPAVAFRTYDGTGNNLLNSSWGSAGSDYLRESSGAAYLDGFSVPPGASRPSPRAISNALADQGGLSTEDERNLATAIYEFGQFLDHDIGLAKGGSTEAFDIPVPAGDPSFDPASTGTKLIYMDRSAFNPATGTTSPRQQINTVTSFVDASHIYGSDATRAAWLRTFQGGKLKSRSTTAGVLLPLNDGTLENDNPVGLPATSLSAAGDVRSNEQPGLTTLHIVFLREHNYQADRLAQIHPTWDDERLYQEARRIVGAEMQAITVREFLPALLGRELPAYQGYRANVNPGLSNVFATAAYRFGHSQVGPDIGVINEQFEEIDSLELSDIFFNPTTIPSIGGINPIVRYFAIDNAQHIDNTIVDALRNFLFGPPGAGGFDLASLNIQRGRDHGLPDYNTVRADFGLPRVTSFSQITSDAARAAKLASLYASVNDIDAWVGILAEDHLPGSSLGPTSVAVILDQFARLRDGDRFWYENNQFGVLDLAMIRRNTLSTILKRHTGITELQSNVFFAADLANAVCALDIDGSGTVSVDDIFVFINKWFARDASADFNADGAINIEDIFQFISAWFAGC